MQSSNSPDTPATDSVPPDIPPPAAIGEMPFCATEHDLAQQLLRTIADDYRYATDLDCWIRRDGDRWRPAENGVQPVITAMTGKTRPDETITADLRIRKWVNQGCPGGHIDIDRGINSPKIVRCTRDQALRSKLILRMQTAAGQNQVAALMKKQASSPGACDYGALTVRTASLDDEPHILWAGSVPFDLARSVTEPVRAENTASAPGQPGGMLADITRWVYARDEDTGAKDIAARFGIPLSEADSYLDQIPDDCDDDDNWRSMTAPHMFSANYFPDISVPTPMWDELTEMIFPDVNEREHALRSLAHGFHGYPSDAAILARAATGLGKSLLAALLSDLLGNYATSVEAKTLFGRGSRSDFAHDEAGGARLVVMNEGHKHDFASTEAFKNFVDPAPLVKPRARHERHPRAIAAHHTVFLTINPNADLDYSDPAVVRRLVPAGFAGDPAKIRKFAAKYGTATARGLASWKREAPGVLAQMIVRCALVLSDPSFYGTQEDAPESLKIGFGAMVADADPFGRWLDERTCDGLPTANNDLLADCQAWCRANKEPVPDPTWFGRAMSSRGVNRHKFDRGTRGWKLALRP